MNNFDNIDEYLTNRLSEQDREVFEQQLNSDAALKSEVELQSQIIEGLKKARIADLKAMLNKVPVEGAPITEFSTLKVAAGLIGTAVIVSAGYLFFNNKTSDLPLLSPPVEDSIVIPEEDIQPNDPNNNKISEEQVTQPETITEQKAQPTQTPKSKPSDKAEASQPVDKPAIDVIDPTEELTETTPTRGNSNKPVLTFPKMNVEVDSSSKKYPFHYQFTDGKMILFGSFDKNLYEIIEINGGSHSVFLFHKDSYYKLDETRTEITPLEPIRDKALIQKLKEYRKK